MLTLQASTLVLCAFGLWASVFMYRKSVAAARGELLEPSVVQTQRARLLGFSNAALGIAFYVAVAAVAIVRDSPALWKAAAGAAYLAAAASVYLAYSLLFRTRRWCPYCWLAHAVNWTLAFVLTAAARV